jgi:hypothetical protein
MIHPLWPGGSCANRGGREPIKSMIFLGQATIGEAASPLEAY